MKVAEYIEELQKLPQDLEVRSLNDEFGTYYPVDKPKVVSIYSRHHTRSGEIRWESLDYLCDDEKPLEEKLVVVV